MGLWNVYVGTFTEAFEWLAGAPSTGIERFEFDDTNGILRRLETITGIRSPQYLDLHPKLSVLYAAEFAHPGSLSAFTLDRDGKFERQSTTSSLGELAVAVSVHPSANLAYVANWGSNSHAVVRLDAEGMPLAAEPFGELERHRPRVAADDAFETMGFPPGRTHQIVPTPSGHAVLAAYNGLDELGVFAADASGALSSQPVVQIEFPRGSGPRHIEFHPSGRFVYVVGEHDSRLHILEAEDGLPARYLDSYSTVPPDYEGRNSPSEIDLHPDGQTLYLGNRGHDSVAVFSVDDSGGIKTLGHHPSLGRGPRTVRIDPSGQFLLVGNCDSGDLVVFEIQEDRHLHPIGSPIDVPSPSSIVFVAAGR